MTMSMPTMLCLVVVVLMSTGCASSVESPARVSLPVESRDPQARQLVSHFREWEGIPYKMGGQSKRGIDCSGFIQLTYRSVFNRSVPRSTELLSQSGRKIDKPTRVGDLLVFKTGSKQQHVGIYIGNGTFIHASTSRGVMASNLDNPYWADAYRQTRRLLD